MSKSSGVWADGRLDARAYYENLTDLYVRYGSGWHHGVWEPGIRCHRDSLQRANEVVLQGLTVGAETRILDVGFGSGGFATWTAGAFGCRVTGITICPDHVMLAKARALELGVENRCDFQTMDMNDIALDDQRFDVVVNQETFCHAEDKPAYLSKIFELLSSGGYWRGFAFAIRRGQLLTRDTQRYEEVKQGFHIPSLLPPERVCDALRSVGFVDVHVEDFTSRVQRSAWLIRNVARIPRWLSRLRLEGLLYAQDPTRRGFQRGHAAACVAYGHGLRTGLFQHVLYSARKP